MRWLEVPLPGDGRSVQLVELAEGRALGTFGDVGALLDPALARWERRQAISLPIDHTLVALPDGRAMAIGGGDYPAYSADTALFDPASDAWRAGPPLPEAIARPAALCVGDVVLAIAHARIYSWRGGGWETVADLPERFSRPQAVAVGGRVLVLDAYSTQQSYNTITRGAVVDVEARTCTAIASCPESDGAALLALGGAAYVIGGEYGEGHSSDRVMRWRPDAGWSRGVALPVSRDGCAAMRLRTGGVAVVGGTENISSLDGGELDIEYRSHAWRYQPTTTMLLGDPDQGWSAEPQPAMSSIRASCAIRGEAIVVADFRTCHAWTP